MTFTKITVLSFLCLPFAILISCSTKPYECVPEADHQSMIRLGKIYEKNEGFDFDGFVMMSDGTVYRDMNMLDTVLTKTDIRLDSETYCKLRQDLMDLYTKTQATNQPGDTTEYIEYLVPERNIRLRARWNPKFDNAGNREWKKLYDRFENQFKPS